MTRVSLRGIGRRIRPLGAVAALGLVLAPGCDADPPEQEPAGAETVPGPCSQVHRAIARWQGNEIGACGPDVTGLLELTALGDGRLLFRKRFSAPDELWRLNADGSFAASPMNANPISGEMLDPRYAGFVVMPGPSPFGTEARVLAYDPRATELRLYGLTSADPALAPALGQGLFVTPARGAWPAGVWKGPSAQPWGHQFLGLAGAVLLDWDPGLGDVRFWRLVPDGTSVVLEGPTHSVAGPAGGEAFRRGHRLVALEAGRLLEWAPRPCPRTAGMPPPRCLGADYRVWSYPTGAALPESIDPDPVAAGRWNSIGAQHEIVAADPGHLVVWTRPTGELRSYPLDPGALDGAAPSGTLIDARLASPVWEPPTTSPELRKLVVVLQDGRSFDATFGSYCQGAPRPDGAPPACDTGPACCEAMPASIPGAPACRVLDPETDQHAPVASPACVRAKMNGGAMDGYAKAAAEPPDALCGSPADFACAPPGAGALALYHARAAGGALADRFFQTYAYTDRPPSFGPYQENFLYLGFTRFSPTVDLRDTPVLTKELSRMLVPWAIYAGPVGLAQVALPGIPQFYDPAWSPFRSIARELEHDIAAGELPPVTIVVPDPDDAERAETPGRPFAAGIRYVDRLASAVDASGQAVDTLFLLTYATAGGYFDHVRPPEPPPLNVDGTSSAADGAPVPYGPRVPLLALGRFARRGHVSHTQLEMSSISVFIEWNWLYGRKLKNAHEQADPRAYRDTAANNLGSLLDPAQTGVEVPR